MKEVYHESGVLPWERNTIQTRIAVTAYVRDGEAEYDLPALIRVAVNEIDSEEDGQLEWHMVKYPYGTSQVIREAIRLFDEAVKAARLEKVVA